jgi:hypothetical protein
MCFVGEKKNENTLYSNGWFGNGNQFGISTKKLVSIGGEKKVANCNELFWLTFTLI